MRKLLFLLCGLSVTGVMARNIVVVGHLADQKTRQVVDFATVQLVKADKPAAAATSKTDGSFQIEAPAGKYQMRVSLVGYKTFQKELTLSQTADTMRVDTLWMEPTDISLGTAVVAATAARVEQKGDTTMFNASAYRVPEGSTLEALIQQLPGVEVADDGTITWNGKTVSEFLINGKDFFKGDTKVAMKNLPPELISKIKAYDKQSDYTKQTGIDDGEETTVLDLTTKKALNQSWITNLDLSYGTRKRYAERFFGTRITDNSRITVFGSANNTADRGFMGGGPRFRRGNSGLTASKMAGADFSWDNGKEERAAGRLELGGNVRYFHSDNDLLSISNSETFLTAGANSSFANSWSKSQSASTNVNSEFRLEWNPDTMTYVNFRPSYSYSTSHSESENRSATFNSNPYDIEGMSSPLDSMFSANVAASLPDAIKAIAVNRNHRYSSSDSKTHNVSGSLMYIRRFGNRGRNFSVRATAGYSKTESESFSLSQIDYWEKGTPNRTDYLNQYSDNPQKNWNAGARAGYSEPLGKNWFAQLNYEFNYRYNDGRRELYEMPIDTLDENWWATAYAKFGTTPTEADLRAAVLDAQNSRYATYRYYTQRASVGVRYTTKDINFSASAEFNPQTTKLEYTRPAQIDTVVTRHVFYVSPRVRFRYKFSKTSRLDINYRGSASQPSMTDLLDVTDDSDPLNISKGNPGLKPSWTNSLRAMYNNYNPDRQQGIMAAVFAQQTSNSISNAMTYDEATGVRTIMPKNINGDWNARGDFMFNTGLGEEKLSTFTSFTNVRYNNNVGYVSIAGSNVSQKNTTRVFNVGERLNLAYRTSWFDIGVNGSLDYQHSRSELQKNANLDTYTFAYGVNANFNFDWGMSISTDASMNSRRGYTDAAMNTNEFVWNAQISQSFLKNKNATIILQYYDILNKQSNVSRTINAQMRQDTWTNAINSYGMIHFIYKLNIFGGKLAQEQKERQNERRGPGDRRPPMGPPMHRMW